MANDERGSTKNVTTAQQPGFKYGSNDVNHKPMDRAAALTSVAVQCTKAKQEVYRIKQFVDMIPHQEQHEDALRLWQAAYDAFDALQTFVQSK